MALPSSRWKRRSIFPRHPSILLGSADAFGTGPFTGPRSGTTALESGKAAYVPACKAVYTGSIPVGASGFQVTKDLGATCACGFGLRQSRGGRGDLLQPTGG